MKLENENFPQILLNGNRRNIERKLQFRSTICGPGKFSSFYELRVETSQFHGRNAERRFFSAIVVAREERKSKCGVREGRGL